MSIQWTVVAGFVYIEAAVIVLMMLPWIRPYLWAKFFKSRFVYRIKAYAWIYSYAIFGLLALLFFDAVREVRKYQNVDITSDIKAHMAPQADTLVHMRLFRAQRNLYLSGFALFLYLVIRRMAYLIMYEAQLAAAADASHKQATSATAAAEKYMKEEIPVIGAPKDEVLKNEIPGKDADLIKAGMAKDTGLSKEVEALRNQLKSAENDRDTMREQAQGLKREYDRLMKDFEHLQDLAEDVREERKVE